MPESTNLSRAARYFAVFFVLGLVPASIGPTLAELARQTSTDLKDISLLFVVRSLGYLCSVRLIGALYDQKKGHPIMIYALLASTTLLFSIPLLHRLWLLSSVLFLLGIAGAFVDLGGNILILRAIKGKVGPYMNGLHFSFGVGAFAAPLFVAASLYLTQSTIYVFWVIAVLGLPVALLLYRTPSPPQPVLTSDPDTQPLAISPYHLGLIVAFYFLYGGAENTMGGWIHTYGIMRNGMDATTAAYLTSAFWGAFTLGRLFAIPLATRLRPKILVLIQLVVSCIFAIMLLTSPANLYLTWCITILTGLAWSSVFPLSLAFLERITAGSGKITSWFFVGASSGAMLLPWFVGQFIESKGPQFFVLVLVISISLGTFILFRIASYLDKAGTIIRDTNSGAAPL